MNHINRFVFNTFLVNTYLLYDESKECIIIDAACYEKSEQKELTDYITRNRLKLVRHLNTHCHVDHILGNQFIADTYSVFPEYHKTSVPFFIAAREIGLSFGYQLDRFPPPKGYLEDGDVIHFGNSGLKVFYTPGHAEGSICLYQQEQGFVMTGDVLFKDTIGRTDLPSGDFNLLMGSIKGKLFTLPDATTVYPGHGPETTIGYEKIHNPFIR
ncbi:MAG: MBL fold metallo-hydrolase, partial [bacterium]